MIRYLKLKISSFFPNRCAFCGKIISGDTLICKKCNETLPRIKQPVCIKCGREKENCCCKKAEKYFDSLVAPFHYIDNVRRGVHEFKFGNSPYYSEAYAVEMANTVKERFAGVNFDYVVAVPLSKKSIKKREYEQAELLADKLSKLLNIPFLSHYITKIYETEPQHGQNYFKRYGNLTGVFDIENSSVAEGKTFLLVDDVSTSGETLNECSKMLWLAGAKNIYCVTLAVTKNRNKKRLNEK